jgi:chemotaxis protein CheX
MNTEVLNPFISATLDALRDMAGLDPRRGTPRLKGRGDASYDISGVAGLTGQVKGFVVLSFQQSAALHVVSAFAGEPFEQLDDDVKDAVGELTNMVAGGAKRGLGEAGYELRFSIPSVIVGPGHTISRPTGVPCFEIPFETDGGSFSVELCLELEA